MCKPTFGVGSLSKIENNFCQDISMSASNDNIQKNRREEGHCVIEAKADTRFSR